MIAATEINCNHFVVRSYDPATGRKQSVTVRSEGEAIRIAHTWNRLYIVETMTRWLNQRSVALQIGNCTLLRTEAQQLNDKIGMACKTSVNHLRKVIAENEKTIRLIAPGAKSAHFGYYEKVILSILQFCQEMKEVEA